MSLLVPDYRLAPSQCDLTEHWFHSILELRVVMSSSNPGEWLLPDGMLVVAKMSNTVFFSFVVFLGSHWGWIALSIPVTEGIITSILSWQLEGWKTPRELQPGWLVGPPPVCPTSFT